MPRQSAPPPPKVPVYVMLPADDAQFLRDLGHDNLTAGVRSAIEIAKAMATPTRKKKGNAQ